MSNNTIKEALLSYMIDTMKGTEAKFSQPINASEDFKKRIKKLVDVKISNNKKKRRIKKVSICIIAAIIASIFIMMSVSAIRSKVVDFFTYLHDSYISFFITKNENEINTIDDIYIPKYLENSNYTLKSQTNQGVKVTSIWENDNNYIYLIQQALNNGVIDIDTENSSYTSKNIENIKVYYTIKHNTYTVNWFSNEFEYSFVLSCSSNIEWSEIEKIILSMECLQE